MTGHPAVLESETAETPTMQGHPMMAIYCYTTFMEIAWLDELAKAHKWEKLALLRAIYPLRHWTGHGMSVDGSRVIEHLDELLARAPR